MKYFVSLWVLPLAAIAHEGLYERIENSGDKLSALIEDIRSNERLSNEQKSELEFMNDSFTENNNYIEHLLRTRIKNRSRTVVRKGGE